MYSSRGGSLNDLPYRLSKCRSLKYPNMPSTVMVRVFGKNSLCKSGQSFIYIESWHAISVLKLLNYSMLSIFQGPVLYLSVSVAYTCPEEIRRETGNKEIPK
jgi:hypothetical protein